jgi:hypothetical protein
VFPLEDEMWHDVTQPINEKGQNMTKKSHSVPKSIDINKLHDTMGHKGEGLQRKTCKHLGIKVTGELKACEACGIAQCCSREENMKVKLRVFKFEVRLWSGFNNEKFTGAFSRGNCRIDDMRLDFDVYDIHILVFAFERNNR